VRDAWQVKSDVEDAAAYTVFSQDRIWNGYSIADLDPPFRPYTEVAIGQQDDQPAAAACLVLRHPAFCSVVPHGAPEGVAAILAKIALPETTYLLAQPAHVPPFRQHYVINGGDEMLRMAVSAATFQAPADSSAQATRLEHGDLAALRRLYLHYPGNAFNDDQLIHGVFYAIRDGDEIVAAGGTHAMAARYGIAAIGNIFTRPDLRGRGLGQAAVAALTADLLNGAGRDVILNVSAANDVARRIYERLGFRAHCRYWEGDVKRKIKDTPAEMMVS